MNVTRCARSRSPAPLRPRLAVAVLVGAVLAALPVAETLAGGSCFWIVSERQLVQINEMDGIDCVPQVLAGVPGEVTALAYRAENATFWLATNGSLGLVNVDRDGLVLGSIQLEGFGRLPRGVADAVDSVWVCTQGGQVAAYDLDGRRLREFSAGSSLQLEGVAADPVNNRVWLIDGNGGLARYSSDGLLEQFTWITPYVPSPTDIEFDRYTERLWIADEKMPLVAIFAADGTYLETRWYAYASAVGIAAGSGTCYECGDGVSTVIDPPHRTAAFQLLGAAPNPFTTSTDIYFELGAEGPVTLEVFDVRGRRVAHVGSESYGLGRDFMTWDGRDDAGRPVGKGVYYVKARSRGRTRTAKVGLVR